MNSIDDLDWGLLPGCFKRHPRIWAAGRHPRPAPPRQGRLRIQLTVARATGRKSREGFGHGSDKAQRWAQVQTVP